MSMTSFVIGSLRYQIETDTIVDITVKSGTTYKNCRFIEVTQMGDEIRVIAEDGRTTIPLRSIESIVEVNPDRYYKRLKVTKRN